MLQMTILDKDRSRSRCESIPCSSLLDTALRKRKKNYGITSGWTSSVSPESPKRPFTLRVKLARFSRTCSKLSDIICVEKQSGKPCPNKNCLLRLSINQYCKSINKINKPLTVHFYRYDKFQILFNKQNYEKKMSKCDLDSFISEAFIHI